MNATSRPLRVAIIGAGPSGFFAADALLKQANDVSIDLFDRLPTPFGLVRYGVAPDHQKIKSVTTLYAKTCDDPRVRFFGNVSFGRDLTHEDVRRHYDAVLYTVGAPTDRNLGIPGEDLLGSLSATEFVAWYNGHPDFADLNPPLNVQGVAVVGMGNVAVDVARMLAKTAAELATTDTADHAVEAFEGSSVQDIYILGRRGPAQAKFTTKELRELGELANADIIVHPEELELDAASEASIAGDPAAKKNIEILREFASRQPEGKPRRLHIRFLVSPVEIEGTDRVAGIRLERNVLEEQNGYINAVGNGSFETLPVGMVLRSVGYRGVALPGVPFDERKGIIPNREGRVLDSTGGSVVHGEYTAGWIKRGPSGVIGTNKADAQETVKALLEDLPNLMPASDDAANPQAIVRLLRERGVQYVTFKDWQALDKYESEAGQKTGRPRVKVTRVEEMLRYCHVELVE